jgi:hypothetical protein
MELSGKIKLLGISFNLSESDKLTLSPAHSENALNIDND